MIKRCLNNITAWINKVCTWLRRWRSCYGSCISNESKTLCVYARTYTYRAQWLINSVYCECCRITFVCNAVQRSYTPWDWWRGDIVYHFRFFLFLFSSSFHFATAPETFSAKHFKLAKPSWAEWIRSALESTQFSRN